MKKNFKYYDYLNNDKVIVKSEKNTDFYFNKSEKKLTGDFVYKNFQKDFVLIAEIHPLCNKTYDAAGIMIFETNDTWSKFVVEQIDETNLNIVSMVTNGLSDDVVGEKLRTDSIFLKVQSINNIIQFYYSYDNEHYIKHRTFYKEFSCIPKVGFVSQSPNGNGTEAKVEKILITQFQESEK